MILFDPEPISAQNLYRLLRRHCLLPRSLEEPAEVVRTATGARVGFIAPENSKTPVAIIVEKPMEPGVSRVWFLPECSNIKEHKTLIASHAEDLRRRWFSEQGHRRMECRVARVRGRVQHVLEKCLGFQMEARCLRAAEDYGKGPEDVVVYSLLESDPIPVAATGKIPREGQDG